MCIRDREFPALPDRRPDRSDSGLLPHHSAGLYLSGPGQCAVLPGPVADSHPVDLRKCKPILKNRRARRSTAARTVIQRKDRQADVYKRQDKELYSNYDVVTAAIEEVDRNKSKAEQAEVDAMAQAIEDAIAALEYRAADYTAVDAAIAKAEALTP